MQCFCGDIAYIYSETTSTILYLYITAKFGLSAKSACTQSYITTLPSYQTKWWDSGENDKICGDNLRCATCIELANAKNNNKMCLHGESRRPCTVT